MKARARKYGIAAAAGLAMTLAVFMGRGGLDASVTKAALQALCDGCFVAGITLFCAGLLMVSAQGGTFDMLVYGMRRALRLVLSEEKQSQFPKTYYDYCAAKRGRERGGFGFLLIVGLGYLAAACVWLALYSAA